MFKEAVPHLGVSLEQGTPDVPDDGQYHVVHNGAVVFSAVSQRKATVEYQRIRDELRKDDPGTGWTPPTREERLRREKAESDLYAVRADSYRRREGIDQRKGGKGGRGGV